MWGGRGGDQEDPTKVVSFELGFGGSVQMYQVKKASRACKSKT